MKKLITLIFLLVLSLTANVYLFMRLDRVEVQMFALNDEPTLLDTLRGVTGHEN